MKAFQKIQAGSLQFVLFIGAVIAVLLLTFVLLSHSHLLFVKKTNKFVEVIKKNDLALRNAINRSEEQFFADDGIETKVDKAYWGLFEKYNVTTSFKKNNFQSVALVGAGINEQTPGLYLKDKQRPLVIVGTARLTGLTYIPEQGIRPGNISGESYFGSSLVYGQTKQSNNQLPRLDAKLLAQVKRLCNQEISKNLEILTPKRNSVVQNSFKEPTKLIVGDVVDLSGISLTGNIKVIASNEIRFDATTALKDVILSAPKINVGSGFNGSFQAFATKTIFVGSNCNLTYPTSLVIHNKNGTRQTKKTTELAAAIFINNGTVVKGSILYLDTSEERVFYPQVKLAENTILYGQVYCEKAIELKGGIRGSLYTASFMALENGNVYQNHLYKGTVNRLELQQQFVGLDFNEIKTTKKVAKWLY
ncbi:hypothetical protein [uncultured Croceitalea sp.]|uniref:hypothetical protein n=1 Tax=uncultured Croceitalea sp. TaxID=1798908 RepID=UPI0033066F1C